MRLKIMLAGLFCDLTANVLLAKDAKQLLQSW